MRDPATLGDMTALRAEIDATDRRLSALLAHRQSLIDRAAEIKTGAGLPARIEARVEEVIANARSNAEAEGIDPELSETLWRALVDWSIRREETVLGQE
ncbi:chorismate mutase [Yangia mangrovi]|uniref:chorismate mutase n=1 Tax=Alloyangia mangrovi TaxID=1779329 RepID=A0A2A3JPY4_9RHOB|nr:chorismate mutase [Alloyangia mangrovi]MCA0938420.1 chorismate mutase [Alloyangia pacifica]MCA0943778.1 chorismate mutase [Alloyangia pacifica]MCT4372091.1 chorismate mutase [Alloyangia mangrovi]